MSQMGQKRKCYNEPMMSAFHPIATEQQTQFYVGFVPTSDVSAAQNRELFRVEARRDQARNSIQRNLLHVSPFLRGFGLSRLGKHIADPARSLGCSDLNDFVLKWLALGILLTGDVGSFALRKSGIEQHVSLQVVGKQVCVAMEPLTVFFSELG